MVAETHDAPVGGAGVAARMKRLPITSLHPTASLHSMASVAVGVGLFLDIYEIFLAGVLSAVLGEEFRLAEGHPALVFAVGALGPMFGFALRRGLPESPRRPESAGRVEEAAALMEGFERQAGASLPRPTAGIQPSPVTGRPRDPLVLFSSVFHIPFPIHQVEIFRTALPGPRSTSSGGGSPGLATTAVSARPNGRALETVGCRAFAGVGTVLSSVEPVMQR